MKSKKNSQLLRDSQLLQLLKESEGATALYDSVDMNIAFVNKAMLGFWGKDDRIVGKTFGGALPEFTEQGFTDILKQVWYSGQTYRATEFPADITIEGITETKYFDFTYQAVLDPEGKTYAIIHTATDVSSHRTAMKTVQEQDLLITFNNELEVLTHTLSHDLQNPLAIAKMGVQYLKNQPDLSSSEKENWAALILNAIGNVENIIGHTVQLNQARLYHYSNECHDMDDIIRKICLECQMIYGVDPYCSFKTGTLDPLYGDKGVLYQIFHNIIGNAVKYSSTIKGPTVHIESKRIDGYILYQIRDNGIGIPAKDVPFVFDQFSRASNVKGHPGTGIGLCLVKKIIARLGGDIKITSILGKGTTVELYFPCYAKNGKKCEGS